MGSVSKVRKRKEVIGGSARPDFVEKRSQPKALLFGLFPVPDFWPLQKHPSDVLQRSGKNSGRSANGSSSGRRTPKSGRNSPGHLHKTNQNPGQACFAMFCCPAQQKDNLLLDPIHEHEENMATKKRDDNFLQGCFGHICGLFKQQQHTRKAASNARSEETASLKKQESLYSNSSSDGSDKDNILDKKDYDVIERQLQKVLKRSTSSIITYGHKDVVYALKSIHLDRVQSSDFMKELKNEVAILKELDHANIVKCYETFMYRGSLYLVLELCSGSDLYCRDPYTEEDARKIIRAMFSAVAYMHSKRITHRGKCFSS